MKASFINYLSLFTSSGTLVCCALPSLLVALGAGAALAGFIADYPALIWLSRHKAYVFVLAAILLIVAGYFQYRARLMPCPTDPAKAKACQSARKTSFYIYIFSVVIFLTGAFFAYIAPYLF